MSWDDVRTWRHSHYCEGCGQVAVCFNPACSEPGRCPDCEAAAVTPGPA